MTTPTVRRAAAATACVAAAALILAPMPAFAQIVAEPITTSAEDPALSLAPIGTFETGVFDSSAAEIVAAHGERLFVVNAQQGAVSVLDASDPTTITELYTLASEGVANSVAVRADGLGVVAIEAPVKTDPGHLVFFDATAPAATVLGTVTVGALPDMVTLSADGAYAVVANEGEPADDFSIDPEGSIGVVRLPDTLAAPVQADVRIADFHAYEGAALHAGVRVFGPTPHGDDHPVSRNLEPEYITVSGATAYASIQEANAIATIDLATATVTDLHALGAKDHGLPGNGLDASDKDGTINITTYPGLYGLYMPDAIASYQAGGETYLVTANEGDAREWGDYAEGARVKALGKNGLAPICAASALAGQTGDAVLGRLNVTTTLGLNEAGDCYDSLYAFGARSFSIWDTDGTQVFDSGDAFEQITAAAVPEFFNSNHTEPNFDGRSDDKGPEPEGVAVGRVGDATYAFVGLERIGGVIVYDITDPAAASFVTYINNRDFAIADAENELSASGDLGAEGVTFIPAETSTTGQPMLAVANEVSGTTTLFSITDLRAPTETTVQVLTLNDFHGRIEADGKSAGAAVVAGAVQQFEAANPNTLFVSAGDNIGASTFTSFIQQDNPTIDALVAAGLDLGAVGNHEFDQGFTDLTDRVLPRYGSRDFGLGANVRVRATGEAALEEYTVREVDGVRIAFIGVVTPDTATMVSPDGVAAIEFENQLTAANRTADAIEAADAADVTVLLAHDGNATEDCTALADADTDFGALVRGAAGSIDAIVSGHTHQAYSCVIDGPDGPRPVIQAHQYGTTLGLLDVTVDTASKELVSIAGSLVPLTDADGTALFPADPTVQAIVDDATDVADAEGSKPVGTISADILRGGTNGSDRGVESSLGNLVADQYLWAASNDSYAGTKAQIGLMNPGGLRADLRYGTDGTVTYRDVANVQPFANTLVTVELTGAQLRAVLEEQWQPEGSSRPKLHLGISDGFSYTYREVAARGAHVTELRFQGEPIDDADTFVVVTNSFLAAGGDNFTSFTAGSNPTDTGQVDLAATVAYFAEHALVDPAPLGRAVLEEAPIGTITVDVGAGTVAQGGTLPVRVSGLEPGEQVHAVVHSDPITVTGIPVADGDGVTAFTVTIPADFEPGEHTLIVSAEPREPVSTTITVTPASTPTPTEPTPTEPTPTEPTPTNPTPTNPTPTEPTPTTPVAPTTPAPPGALPITGAELPLGAGFAAAFLVAAGLLVVALRRRAS